MKNKYDKALDAINELFADTSLSASETRDCLRDLLSEIHLLVDALDADIRKDNQ